MKSVDMSLLTPAAALSGVDLAETAELQHLVTEAAAFLAGFPWCGGVKEQYEGFSIAGVVGVFLLRIVPLHPDVDEWMWVIVGDLPPAYLVTDNASTATEALNVYVEEMSLWVAAAQRGESVDDLIPVNVEPSTESAQMLQSRLSFLKHKVIPQSSRRPDH